MTTNIDQKIAVVIPSYNRKEVTLACIQKLNAASCQPAIFVCDSASTDGTGEAAAKEPNVKLLNASASAWWSGAVNVGIQRALQENFDLIVILNDDIEFEIDLISKLLSKHQQYPTSIISPSQDTPTGAFLGILYKGSFKKMEIMHRSDKDSVVDTSNGCCLLVPREVFEAVGLIDALHCPHLYGDTEFQLRAQRSGFSTIGCPSIHIKQLGATDYYSRLKFRSLFTFSGSPLHFAAYTQFGSALFGGWARFSIFGVIYHSGYIKGFLKALALFSRESIVRLKR